MTETHKYVKGDTVFWLFLVSCCVDLHERRNLSSGEELQVGDEGSRKKRGSRRRPHPCIQCQVSRVWDSTAAM